MAFDSKYMATEIIPTPTKNTEHKLEGHNHLEWSQKIKVYLRILEKDLSFN